VISVVTQNPERIVQRTSSR